MGRIGSGVRVGASFQKMPVSWVGLGQESGPHLVSRIGSGPHPPHGSGRVRSTG